MTTTQLDPRSLDFALDAQRTLARLGDQLVGLSRDQGRVRQQLKEQGRRLSELEADIRADTLADVGEDGRLRHTNDKARDAAVAKAIVAHLQARVLRGAIDALETESAGLDVDCADLTRRRQDLHALLGYASNWLRWTAAETEHARP